MFLTDVVEDDILEFFLKVLRWNLIRAITIWALVISQYKKSY